MNLSAVGSLMVFSAAAWLGVGIYLVPSMLATLRGHRNTAAIVVLNVLGGWTVVGWIGAMVWASTHDAGSRKWGAAYTSILAWVAIPPVLLLVLGTVLQRFPPPGNHPSVAVLDKYGLSVAVGASDTIALYRSRKLISMVHGFDGDVTTIVTGERFAMSPDSLKLTLIAAIGREIQSVKGLNRIVVREYGSRRLLGGWSRAGGAYLVSD